MTKKLIPLTVYIAGPMTGLPEHNYPAFNAAEKALAREGFHVLNPAHNEANDWLGYMRRALAQIINADIVFFLRGWRKSKGASMEHRIAVELGLVICYESDVCGEQDLQLMETEAASKAELEKAMAQKETESMPKKPLSKHSVGAGEVPLRDLNVVLKFIEAHAAWTLPLPVVDAACALRSMTPT